MNPYDEEPYDEAHQRCTRKQMESMDSLNWVMGGLAVAILIGGMLMMFTTVFTTKR